MSLQVSLATKYFLTIILGTRLYWLSSPVYPTYVALQGGGLVHAPTLSTLHLQVGVDCLNMLRFIIWWLEVKAEEQYSHSKFRTFT